MSINPSKTIAAITNVVGRYTRSISIARDHLDASAIDGYIVTPTVANALLRIGRGLRGPSTQRAWKVIGPYGSGKSALGLFVANLVSQTDTRHPAFKLLRQSAPEADKYFRPGLKLLAVIVTGSRASFTLETAKAIVATVSRLSIQGRKPKIIEQFDAEKQTYKRQTLASSFPALVDDFVSYVKTQDYAGVVFIIDELGKFIEHAALNRVEGDLYGFQQLAELACGNMDLAVSVIALQHQQFEDYAEGIGQELPDEWGKVSARFEEIAFDEPLEQTANLLAASLQHNQSAMDKLKITAYAKDIYTDYFAGRRGNGMVVESARTLGAHLYPLHPAALTALCFVSKRLGQSERSIFAFLNGSEPFGFQDFITQTAASTSSWYCVHNLFDYLAAGGALRFRSLETRRRWEHALARIHSAHSFSLLQISVLKTVAIEECFGPFSPEGLQLEGICTSLLAKKDDGDVRKAVEHLVSQGVLVLRRSSKEYVLCTDRELNIEALFSEAAEKINLVLGTTIGLRQFTESRRIVANKHYQSTGTLRTAGQVVCLFADLDSLDKWPVPNEVDGELVIVACSKKEFSQAKDIARAAQRLKNPSRVARFILVDDVAERRLTEFVCWQQVSASIASRPLDPWTKNYIEDRMSRARRAVESTLIGSIEAGDSKYCSEWFYVGAAVANSRDWNGSQICSFVFDTLYCDAPVLRNELINRRKLSSAIALARQKLIEGALAKPSAPIFGIEEFPPERLIYHSIALNSGLHAQASGKVWELKSVDKLKASSWQPVIKVIHALISAGGRVGVDHVVATVGRAPIGLREPAAMTLIALYILANQSTIGLFERGTFVPILTQEHFSRLFRNPKLFELRQFECDGATKGLLKGYSNILSSVGIPIGVNLGIADIARELIRWYLRLPQFAKVTTSVSPATKEFRDVLRKAVDPVDMIVIGLPQAVARLGTPSSKNSLEPVRVAMTELSMIERQLRGKIAGILGVSFAIQGDLKDVRAQLMQECAGRGNELIDFKLRSFVLRCSDAALTDEKWLDSIASLLSRKAIEGWDDSSLSEFEAEAKALAIKFRKWIAIVLQKRGSRTDALSRYLSVSVIDGTGGERTAIVTASPELVQDGAQLVRSMLKQANGDRDKASTILALALAELQNEQTLPSQEIANHG